MSSKKKKSKTVSISKKPAGKVSGLSKPTRDGSTMHAKWSIPSTATSSKRNDRWESQAATWTFAQTFRETKYSQTQIVKDAVAKKKAKKIEYTRVAKKGKTDILYTNTATYQSFLRVYNQVLYVTTSAGISYQYNKRTIKKGKVNPKTGKKVKKATKIYDTAKGPATQTGQKTVKCMQIPIKTKAITQRIDFDKYHPLVPYRYLNSVTIAVHGVNKKGSGKAKKSSSYKFSVPRIPVMSDVTFNSDNGGNGVASVNIDATSEGGQHKYRTCYWVTRQDNFTSGYKTAAVLGDKKYTKTDEFTSSTDISGFAAITYDQWIKLTFRAFSQGCAGDSNQATPKSYTIAYPSQAVVKTIDVKPDSEYVWNSETQKFEPSAVDEHNGIVIVNMGFVDTVNHPVDKVELYRLKSKVKTPEEAAAITSGWTKVKEDNGTVTAMQDVIGGTDGAYPPTGVRVWYRLVTTHGPFTRIGPAFEAAALYHGPSTVSFIDVRAVDDGESPTALELTYGFKKDEADGTQVEWSTFKNAIHSNHPPDTYDDIYVVSQEDAKEIMTQYGVSGFNFISQFYITDLEEGAKYYLSGARYTEVEEGRILGDRTFWKDPVTGSVKQVLFGMKPANVALTTPTAVNPDTQFDVSWTFDSSFEQTAYTLYYVNADGATVLRSKQETSDMATVITLDEIERAKYYNTGNGAYEVQLRVEVETTGLSATSENAMTTISQPPDCQISWMNDDMVLAKQPASINYRCTQNGRLLVTIFAEGIDGEVAPDVDYVQYDGDVVWTGVIDVAANVGNDDPATFTFPEELAFHQNGKYTVSAYLRNTETGLESEIREVGFAVDWSHRAEPPSELSTIQSDQDSKAVTITPRRPSNFDEERPDVCDIYRVTPDGSYLVMQSVDFGRTVVDRYAPYSKTANLRYALVTRTKDGDTAYTEIGYGLKGHAIRFEWDVDSETKIPKRVLEVPYNLRMGSTYTKDFERRLHLDGSVTGHWNLGIQRDDNLQTDLIKLSDPEQKELVRHLARYPGAIFVRTPDGCAYQADVQVTQFQTDYDSLVVPVTFAAKEIDLSEAFTALLGSDAQNG